MRSAALLCLVLIAAPALPSVAESYTLRRGDTLYSVSRKFRIPLDDLLLANNITDPNSLKIGTRLEIPEAYGEVRAQKGDTLYSIARRFAIPIGELRRINSLASDHVLKVGEVLRVPEAAWEQDVRKQTVAPAAPETAKVGTGVPYWPHPGEVRHLEGQLAPGVAIQGTEGDPVLSVSSGRVTWAAPFRGYGHIVFVKSENGVTFAYAGASELLVRVGDRVSAGTRLATLGVHPHDGVAKVFFFAARGSEPLHPANAPRT